MKNSKHMGWFLFPSAIGILVFYCIPFLFSFYYAVIDTMGNRSFVGLQHFIDTLHNPAFQRGLINTTRFLLFSLPLLFGCALAIALSLKRVSKGRGMMLLMLLLPFVVPSGSVVYFWNLLFDVHGFLNQIRHAFNLSPVNWAHTDAVMAIAVLLFIWKNIGISALLFVTGLNRIPQQYGEIAEIEGANAWQKFRHITVVYLMPTFLIVLLLAIVGSFKLFKELYLLYGSYPHEQIYMLQHFMNNQFVNINMQKLASASYVLFVLLGGTIIALFYMQKRWSDRFSHMELGTQRKSQVQGHVRGRGFSYFFLLSCVGFCVLPVLFVFAKSLISQGGLTLSQYSEFLFQRPMVLKMYWNSIWIVLPIVLGQCLLAPLAAYAFERWQWKWKEVLFLVYMLIMLMPLQVLLVPHYIMADWLGMKDSVLAIIIPGIFHPLGVFLIRLQLKGFPKECIEAAQVCGASEWQVFRWIVLPNLKASLATVVILIFAEYWNVVDQAIVFIKNIYDQPLSVYLGSMMKGDPSIVFAVSSFYMIPILILFFFSQDDFLGDTDVYKESQKSV